MNERMQSICYELKEGITIIRGYSSMGGVDCQSFSVLFLSFQESGRRDGFHPGTGQQPHPVDVLRRMDGGYHTGMSPGLTYMVPTDLPRYVSGTYLYGTGGLT